MGLADVQGAKRFSAQPSLPFLMRLQIRLLCGYDGPYEATDFWTATVMDGDGTCMIFESNPLRRVPRACGVKDTAHRPTALDRRPTRAGILSIPRRVFQGVRWIIASLFGLYCLLVILSVLATIPLLQFLSLGYLLEAAARVARGQGRLRAGLFGLPIAGRMGGAALGCWILLQPLRLMTDVRRERGLLSAHEATQFAWNIAYWVLFALVLGWIGWALYRGGRLRSFFWPAPVRLLREIRKRGPLGMYRNARDRVYDLMVRLRLPYFFLLGFRGFVLASLWLVLPITVLVLSTQTHEEGLTVLTALIGGLMLAFVLMVLPYAQVNFAISGKFQDGLDRKRVRQQFRKAPIAFWIALLTTLLFALPLYLLKAELIPREAAWLPSFVFVLSILPARLLTGWAIGRARAREQPRHFLFRQLGRFGALPIVVVYAAIVYLTQFISWYGALSLYEQHAFLLPVPFLDL